jgi:hypothetical protein
MDKKGRVDLCNNNSDDGGGGGDIMELWVCIMWGHYFKENFLMGPFCWKPSHLLIFILLIRELVRCVRVICSFYVDSIGASHIFGCCVC